MCDATALRNPIVYFVARSQLQMKPVSLVLSLKLREAMPVFTLSFHESSGSPLLQFAGSIGYRLQAVYIRELKKNSRGRRRQRRQNNKTNYTRQKAHVNMPSCETSIAPFPRCLQNVVNISTIIVDLFVY